MKLKDMTFERHKLVSQFVIPAEPGHELHIHTLAGAAYVSQKSNVRMKIERPDGPFSAPESGLFCGMEEPIVISPLEVADLVIAKAKVAGPAHTSPSFVESRRHLIGGGPSQRTVYEILGGGGPSQRLRFGETHNDRGGWSSWPGHSFDKRPELAPQFEEAFLCFTRPKEGYGLIQLSGVYHDGMETDSARVVRSGDMFSVPLGTHPIVGAPDTELMYVWAYISPIDKIYGQWAEDVGSYL